MERELKTELEQVTCAKLDLQARVRDMEHQLYASQVKDALRLHCLCFFVSLGYLLGPFWPLQSKPQSVKKLP